MFVERQDLRSMEWEARTNLSSIVLRMWDLVNSWPEEGLLPNTDWNELLEEAGLMNLNSDWNNLFTNVDPNFATPL